jgi:hypothetical protein
LLPAITPLPSSLYKIDPRAPAAAPLLTSASHTLSPPLHTPPPEAHHRRSSTGLDLRRCLISSAVCYVKDPREGEQLNHPSLFCPGLP